MSSPASSASRRSSRRRAAKNPNDVSSPSLAQMPSTPSTVQRNAMDTSLSISSPPQQENSKFVLII